MVCESWCEIMHKASTAAAAAVEGPDHKTHRLSGLSCMDKIKRKQDHWVQLSASLNKVRVAVRRGLLLLLMPTPTIVLKHSRNTVHGRTRFRSTAPSFPGDPPAS